MAITFFHLSQDMKNSYKSRPFYQSKQGVSRVRVKINDSSSNILNRFFPHRPTVRIIIKCLNIYLALIWSIAMSKLSQTCPVTSPPYQISTFELPRINPQESTPKNQPPRICISLLIQILPKHPLMTGIIGSNTKLGGVTAIGWGSQLTVRLLYYFNTFAVSYRRQWRKSSAVVVPTIWYHVDLACE